MLGWLLNLGFAAGPTEVSAVCYLLAESSSKFIVEADNGFLILETCNIFIEGVCDGQSVSIPDSVRDNRFRVGSEGVRIRRQIN